MIDFNIAINAIRRNNGFQPNRNDSSYYRTYTIENSKPIQVRVSNHGTHLWTWIDRNYDPSRAINYCIVFSENGDCASNTKVNMNITQQNEQGQKMIVGTRNNFEVVQYVYNCQNLTANEVSKINGAIQNIWQTKVFTDPFSNDPIKKAKVIRLRPNESPINESSFRFDNIIKEVLDKFLKRK